MSDIWTMECTCGKEIATIELKPGIKVIFHKEDLPIVSLFTWHLKVRKKKNYAVCTLWDKYEEMPNKISMHRLLGNIPKGKLTDHKNGNGLDNRTCNIRPCDHSQNASNRRYESKQEYIGVSRYGETCFEACIWSKGKRYGLGCHETAKEAALVRDKAAIKYHGEFAALNFPLMPREG